MPRPLPLLVALALPLAAGCGGSNLEAPLTDAGGRPDLGRAEEFPVIPPGGLPDLALPGFGPPYPIVLVHGMAGFRNIGPLGYFHKIPEAMQKDGHSVWISRSDPINDSEVRGEQVKAYVLDVLRRTGKAKAILVGHSQGGYDVSYVANRLGPRIAAVVTIASPVKGDPIADFIFTETGPLVQQVLAKLLEIYGAVQGFDSNAQRQVRLFTHAGSQAFFAKYPLDPNVAYYSIAGRSANAPAGGLDCWSADTPAFIRRWDGVRDPLDPLFAIPAQVYDRMKQVPVHDGLVTAASTHLGTFLGCIPADHMDQVNQFAGDSPGFGNSFDAVAFFRDLANWLRSRGY